MPREMLHRFSILTAILTFPAIFAGATVTTRGAGLSVPDWPLSFGTLFPAMEGGVLYEHGHRLLAGLVGMLTLVLAFWVQAVEPRRWVRGLAWSALALVATQAVLGGTTVLLQLPPVLSVLHACLAQAFLALVGAIAIVTSPSFGAIKPPAGRRPPDRPLRLLTISLAAAIFLQTGLGAAMRHLNASMAIPDFPLAFGHLLPPADELARREVVINFAHRLGALAVLAIAGPTITRSILSGIPGLIRPAVILTGLLMLQVLLGAATVWSGRAELAATGHAALGSLVLLTAVVMAIGAFKGVSSPAAARAEPALPPGTTAASGSLT